MIPRDSIVRNERGAALVLGLMVLLALAVLSAVLMVSLKAETRIAGLDIRTAEALNVAEAGVNEVVAHIRNGNIENSGLNPRMVAQVFNAPAGSVPAVGADTTGIPTGTGFGALLRSLTQATPPIDLTPIGMPGCVAHVVDPIATLYLSPSSSVQLPESIPNAPGLIGVVLVGQALTYSPPLTPLGLVASNGMVLTLGL